MTKQLLFTKSIELILPTSLVLFHLKYQGPRTVGTLDGFLLNLADLTYSYLPGDRAF
jgi:hypothetical protein